MWLKNISILFSFVLLLSACEKSNNNGNSSGRILKKAKGAPGEIIVVIDSATYQGKVGDAVKSVFKGDIQWLSRPQSQFTTRIVSPQDLNSVLRDSKNLVYITVINDNNRGNKILKNNFTKASLERIKEDRSVYMFTKKDEFARGQEVMHLFGLNEEDLIKNLEENKEKIRDYFNDIELKRMQSKLFSAREEKGIEDLVAQKFGCKIRIPYGYEAAIQDEKFIWLRFLDPEIDRSIYITYTDYVSEEQFTKENLIAFRDSVAQEHLYGDPEKPNTFMVTETENFPVFHEQTNFNGKYAIQMRGLWKTNNLSMGGPFISYALVDEEQRRLYYIEGFLYAPGKSQREYVRELEAILRTFSTTEKKS